MDAYQKLLSFYQNKANRKMTTQDFFAEMAHEFQCSENTALLIWYAEQRSWFDPNMIDVLITMERQGKELPNLVSGDFRWDAENKTFTEDLDD